MNKRELAARYIQALQEEGYRPELDKDGNVVFKSEGRVFQITIDEKDQLYYRLSLPNFWSIDDPDKELPQVLAAADYANSHTKAAKVFTVRDNVWANVELFLGGPDQIRSAVSRSMSALQASVSKFAEKMMK